MIHTRACLTPRLDSLTCTFVDGIQSKFRSPRIVIIIEGNVLIYYKKIRKWNIGMAQKEGRKKLLYTYIHIVLASIASIYCCRYVMVKCILLSTFKLMKRGWSAVCQSVKRKDRVLQQYRACIVDLYGLMCALCVYVYKPSRSCLHSFCAIPLIIYSTF